MAKDPVCGMMVVEEKGLKYVYQSRTFYFCSEYCRNLFARNPDRYLDPVPCAGRGSREEKSIAYFSMEIAADPRIPTYSGGLGVLAGDTLRSCADLGVPVVGVTLLYQEGYFFQKLDGQGNQEESPVHWNPREHLTLLPEPAEVRIEGRMVRVRAWQYEIPGREGCPLPVIFLDTDLPENSSWDRELTARLYSGDDRYRLGQEIILGIGGIRMLRRLGYQGIRRYHMNEGHAALLALELLREGKESAGDWDFEGVRRSCIFTTHTPVASGHDRFSYELVQKLLGDHVPLEVLRMLGGDDLLNMTRLALNISHYVNGVAKRHGEVSREMFPGYVIDSITNGVHSVTWTAPSFQRLYDQYIPGWARDPFLLRSVLGVPRPEIWSAHLEAKKALIDHVNRETNAGLDYETFTIGFARRATLYKRMDLIFSDLERLRRISREVGAIQMVFAGKAHPRDWPGKELIKRVFAVSRQLGGDVKLVYLPNYGLETARLFIAGADLWLNTPQRPLEASGTSGMKAAHNGVPSFSIFDGWWVEGHIEGLTGWSIGAKTAVPETPAEEAGEIYDKLEKVILPLYYRENEGWREVMGHTIALNASYFNTHRMVQQYALNAYLL